MSTQLIKPNYLVILPPTQHHSFFRNLPPLFLKNRFIGENIRLLDSIINYTDTEQIPGLLLFVDFEKAFDSVEWSFIGKTLKYYNLGPSLIAWIKLFYTDISSCIQNNGWASEFFALGRGVRQGCPLSHYLFILCAEILGSAVTNDKEVHGIMISGSECKISQYADDTMMAHNPHFQQLYTCLTHLAQCPA